MDQNKVFQKAENISFNIKSPFIDNSEKNINYELSRIIIAQ